MWSALFYAIFISSESFCSTEFSNGRILFFALEPTGLPYPQDQTASLLKSYHFTKTFHFSKANHIHKIRPLTF